MLVRIFFFTALLSLAGCSSVPDSIKLPESTSLPAFEQVVAIPENHKGKMVRFGGVIAEIENKEQGTLVELVQFPLKSYGRPLVSDDSPGRFRAYVKGFLDPMVYKKGRSITFTGTFRGIEEGTVGEHKYGFPVIDANGYHLWKEIKEVEVSSIQLWHHPFWINHTYYPFYPYHQRVIIRNGRDGAGAKGGAATKETGSRNQ
ncbi:Slp family lipoprotein [Aestuariibacter sp. AA17]|uniref:Slp family lipoprotein n=1 Tax=Fluctibacter corallii TaxID=2984329 RepID=A0ABT3A8V0_9ALTE|nr:Slp family lipoprotein [Aestuariibacter sp. AA17]MCV2885096.1 Slp family lipoprotein [Aestuariibacter sp. AA17]